MSASVHSVAARTLRRYGSAIGLDPAFTVLDQPDTTDLLSLVRDELAPPQLPGLRQADWRGQQQQQQQQQEGGGCSPG